MNQKLAALAAAQGGPFRVAQAREAGYSARAINVNVATREWTRLRRGVCVDSRLVAEAGEGKGLLVLEAAAAVLAMNAPGAVCSHESAALLNDIELLRPPPAGVVSMTRPPAGPGADKLKRIRLYRAGLPGPHVRVSQGVPVTSPARTVLDLARRLPFVDAVVAIDSALGRLGVSRHQLLEVAFGCRSWPGIKHAEAAIAAARPCSRGPLGTFARLMCQAHELPEPRTEVLLHPPGHPALEADLYWPDFGVAVLLTDWKAKPLALRDYGGIVVLELSLPDVTLNAEACVRNLRQAFRTTTAPTAAQAA